MPLLEPSLSTSSGFFIGFSALVILTDASSVPPDCPTVCPTSLGIWLVTSA